MIKNHTSRYMVRSLFTVPSENAFFHALFLIPPAPPSLLIRLVLLPIPVRIYLQSYWWQYIYLPDDLLGISGNRKCSTGARRLDNPAMIPVFSAIFISPTQKDITPIMVIQSVTASFAESSAACNRRKCAVKCANTTLHQDHKCSEIIHMYLSGFSFYFYISPYMYHYSYRTFQLFFLNVNIYITK